jgi:hypothetical protein
VRVNSLGSVIVIFKSEGLAALIVNVFAILIFIIDSERRTNWLLGVYPIFRLIGCIVTVDVPFSIK